jgi:hypothetical protein
MLHIISDYSYDKLPSLTSVRHIFKLSERQLRKLSNAQKLHYRKMVLQIINTNKIDLNIYNINKYYNKSYNHSKLFLHNLITRLLHLKYFYDDDILLQILLMYDNLSLPMCKTYNNEEYVLLHMFVNNIILLIDDLIEFIKYIYTQYPTFVKLYKNCNILTSNSKVINILTNWIMLNIADHIPREIILNKTKYIKFFHDQYYNLHVKNYSNYVIFHYSNQVMCSLFEEYSKYIDDIITYVDNK